MGNFGKRLLIITLSALAVVAIAITGNSIQQAKRLHKVSNSSEVVYSADGVSVTKGDLWSTMISSSITGSLNQYADKALLKDLMDSFTDQQVQDKITMLKHNVTSMDDVEGSEEISEDLFNNNLYALGYFGADGAKEYARYSLATEAYAKYRAQNGLTTGKFNSETLNSETLSKELKDSKKYKDVSAISITFASGKDYKQALEKIAADYSILFVDESTSSTNIYSIRKYNAAYKNSKPYLGSEIDAEKITEGNYGWQYTTTEDDVTSTYAIAIKDNTWYKYLVETATKTTLDDVTTTTIKFNLLTADNEIIDNDENKDAIATKVADNKKIYDDLKAETEDNVVFVSTNIVNSESKEYNIDMFDDSEYVSFYNEKDADDEWYYEVYSSLYNSYYNELIELGLKPEAPSLDEIKKEEKTLFESFDEYISSLTENKFTYSYKELNAIRSAFATALFDTLKRSDDNSSVPYTKSMSVETSSTSGTPYYVIYKLTETTEYEVSDEDLTQYKEDKINELSKNTSFISMALAELRKEAKYKLFDSFVVYDYKDLIEYNSSSNAYGVSDAKEVKKYVKKGAYSAKKLASFKAATIEAQEGKISSVSFGKKQTVKVDDLYDYNMNTQGALYIATTVLNKNLENHSLFTKFHGDTFNKVNYLKSDNERVTQYRESAQYYNYLYEYSKQNPTIGSYYGLGTYDSLKDFLYTYLGFRSFDDYVHAMERQTMKIVYLYDYVVNTDLASKDVQNETNFDNLFFNNQENNTGFDFLNILNSQYSVDVNHVLFSVDLDEDGSYDNYKDFNKDHEGDIKNVYDQKLEELRVLLFDYISRKATLSSTSYTVLDDFVKDFNESEEFYQYRSVGIRAKHESLGSVTETSVSSYVKEFRAGVETLKDIIESDAFNKALGYVIGEELVATDFGQHFIIASPTNGYEKVEFDDNELKNDIVAYLQNKTYVSLFGSTDDPESKSKLVYENMDFPVLDSEIETKLALFTDELSLVLDESSSYHSTLITLRSLVTSNDASSYGDQIQKIISAYEYAMFNTEE